ncbi:unnamed protein product [Rotaria sp. Silwood1]|nr:unnamed protein product [Rotaria sp. Silwood1]
MDTKDSGTKDDATVNNNNELVDINNQQHSFLFRFGTRTLVYTGVAGVVGMFGIPAAFSWIGFSSIGVTAGSWAAWWQATHFVPGIFGIMQSVTATGAVGVLFTKVGMGAGVIKAYMDAKNNQTETKIDNNEKVQ